MITIEENDPIKLSGTSSLILKFSYNSGIIDIIKSCDKYIYHPQYKFWELPCNTLAYLLDELTYYDDITLILKKDKPKKLFYPKLTDKYKTKPFKHQLEGIEWGLNLDQGGLLLDDPGLGKSLQMIYLAEELKEQKGLQHCLIICGINTLKRNWKQEIEKHSNETCRVIGEKISKKGKISYSSIKDRAKELKEPLDAFFYILNVESLRYNEIIDAINKSSNSIDLIVFDECQCCNNPSSHQANGLLKLKQARLKIGLTGTLLTNNIINAFVPLKWIGTEKSTLTNFKGLYCEFGGFGGHQIIGYKNVDILKQEIESCSLRRTKDILTDLPPKTVILERLEMNDQHREFYDAVKNGIKEEVDKINLNTTNVLSLTVRLLEATSCPSVLTTENILATKLQRAVELVEEICGHNEKVVIMSRFKEPVRLLEKMLAQYKPLLGDGDVSEDVFERNKKLFQEDNEHMIWLGTHSKSGTGITLNRASYMILIDCPWTAAVTKQVEDRIHRIGSKNSVFIYRLICINTIDEVVEKAIELKGALADFVIDDKTDEKTVQLLTDYILS